MKSTQLLTLLTIMTASPLILRATDTALKPYPLQTCIISGEKLGGMGKAVIFAYEGQEIKVCCRECKNEFQDNPAEGMKKFKAAVAEVSAKP